MEKEFFTFTHNGKKHKIFLFAVQRLEKMGVIVNEEYFDNAFKYVNPYWHDVSDTNYLMLVNQDYWNRVVYDEEKGLGKIVEYKDGKLINKYKNLYEAVTMGCLDNLYSFEYFHNKEIFPKYEKYNFFNSNVTICSSHLYIETLNDFVKETSKILNNKSTKDSYNFFKKRLFKNYTLEEFTNQKILNMCYQFGEVIHYNNEYLKDQKNNPRFKIDEKDYKKQLEILKNRYFVKKTLFEKVTRINDYKNVSGIYVFCLDKYRGYYVGQAKSSLYKRTTQHFTSPSSDFDNNHKANDVNEIYILRCPVEIINRVEQDCIATISKKYSLNSSVGGEALAFISDKEYKESNYLFDKTQLKKILNLLKK